MAAEGKAEAGKAEAGKDSPEKAADRFLHQGFLMDVTHSTLLEMYRCVEECGEQTGTLDSCSWTPGCQLYDS